MRGLPHVTHNQLGAKKGSPGEYFQTESILPCHQMLLHIATLSLEKIGSTSSHMMQRKVTLQVKSACWKILEKRIISWIEQVPHTKKGPALQN
jgi:hypothetical protein